MYLKLVFEDMTQALAQEARGFSPSSKQARLAAKAALAAVTAVLAALWLETGHYQTAGITALVVTLPNAGTTLVKCLNRLAGTVAGGILGVASVALFSQSQVMTLAWVFATAFATILHSAKHGRDRYAYVMAGFTGNIILLGSLTAPEAAYDTAFYRVFEICIGITAAWFVNGLLWPEQSGPVLVKNMRRILELLQGMVEQTCAAAVDEAPLPKQYARRAAEAGRLTAASESLLYNARLEHAFSPNRQAFFMRLADAADACLRELSDFNTAAGRRESAGQAKGSGYQTLYREEITAIQQRLGETLQALADCLEASPPPGEAVRARLALLRQALDALDAAYAKRRHTREQYQYAIAEVMQFHHFERMIRAAAEALENAEPLERSAPPEAKPRAAMDDYEQSLVFRQALAGGLAMVLTPLLWIWLDLPGLYEIAISSLIILVVEDVESQRKGLLRLTGCTLGGAIGLALLYFPAMADFPVWIACLFTSLFFVKYIHYGDPRCAYIGLQAGIAILVTMVQGAAPGESLAPPLERWAAIAAAILIMNTGVALLRPVPPLERIARELDRCRALSQRLPAVLAEALRDPSAAAEAPPALRADIASWPRRRPTPNPPWTCSGAWSFLGRNRRGRSQNRCGFVVVWRADWLP